MRRCLIALTLAVAALPARADDIVLRPLVIAGLDPEIPFRR